MPHLHDPDSRQFYDLWSDDQRMAQEERPHDQGCWIDYHELDAGLGLSVEDDKLAHQRYAGDYNSARLHGHDREGLIHYIKSAESSRWLQHGSVRNDGAGHHMPYSSRTDSAANEGSSTENSKNISQEVVHNASLELASPAEIQRPRSALHSGDFREGTPQAEGQQRLPQYPISDRLADTGNPLFASSPTTPWFTPSFPSRAQTALAQALEAQVTPAIRPPAPSVASFSSSYVLKAPTSPLVHQANNTDLDFSPRTDGHDLSTLYDKASRRRTLPPDTFRDLEPFSAQAGAAHTTRWDFGAHRHARRSLAASYSLQLASSVQGHSPRARRPSVSSESSYRTRAPMVGSYEESILRGRMSTCPSKPLDFTAQIGVLGKGNCKGSLKCPPHVTVSFPAVFYSYPTSGPGRSISDDSPSPYVGMIDLENSLSRDTSSCSRRRRRHQSPADARNVRNTEAAIHARSNDQEALRRREKRHRRAESPKSPPGGCYRIPQQGQLQVMIKNPNKTAVKLFLVPYDLSDMEPGTKTFIRQRSYSAGPVLDMPLSARRNYGTDRPEASLTSSDDPKDKPVLRYLIHLNICCPSRGRYYLHSTIRVVFANRVPDGKENLRNEIQHPEPRYSPYRLSREPNPLRVSTKISTGSESRRPSPCPPESTAERPPHPFQPIPSIRHEIAGLGATVAHTALPLEPRLYNKLSKGDAGYGGYHHGPSRSPEGESLLARKLRGLDVQKPDSSPERHR
ncbi:hypothetical protein BJX61DRAFT_216095 [Aspergillus egyptiacus]|nr:hypothetical protein BJX61DRAFT_216095 [Aspergillus egyptiacus]